ncbi:MAG: hypothetical protein KC503_42475, partial [Myxococcales bacterium]|nr:hypothetical protein [Myxococcales bacterium]
MTYQLLGNRVRICFGCGGSVPAPIAGGHITCPACGATQTVSPRRSLPSARFVGVEVASERERLELLRKQLDGRPSHYASFDAPERLAHLELAYDDVRLPILLLEAFRKAVKRCESAAGESASFDLQRDVCWIAGKARNSFSMRNVVLRAAPYIATALDVVRDPGLVQQLLLMSCDMARHGGDLARADALLALCDARSMFVDLDSDYRTTAAMLALARDNPRRALQLVGARDSDVPFCAATIYQARMTRTAALELLGLRDEAERALCQNRDVLGDEIVSDWLEGSRLLAPAADVWRRIRARDGDDNGDGDDDWHELAECEWFDVEDASAPPTSLPPVAELPDLLAPASNSAGSPYRDAPFDTPVEALAPMRMPAPPMSVLFSVLALLALMITL